MIDALKASGLGWVHLDTTFGAWFKAKALVALARFVCKHPLLLACP